MVASLCTDTRAQLLASAAAIEKLLAAARRGECTSAGKRKADQPGGIVSIWPTHTTSVFMLFERRMLEELTR